MGTTKNKVICQNKRAHYDYFIEDVYECGIDGIIMQDLGLAKFAIDNFPGLEIHASTQMTAHNVEGVKKLKELGFKRVVLSRELSLKEIKKIYDETRNGFRNVYSWSFVYFVFRAMFNE